MNLDSIKVRFIRTAFGVDATLHFAIYGSADITNLGTALWTQDVAANTLAQDTATTLTLLPDIAIPLDVIFIMTFTGVGDLKTTVVFYSDAINIYKVNTNANPTFIHYLNSSWDGGVDWDLSATANLYVQFTIDGVLYGANPTTSTASVLDQKLTVPQGYLTFDWATMVTFPSVAPYNPTPIDTATDVDPQITALTWECDGTPDGYYVYFGTLSPTLRGRVTEKSWSPDFILDLSTTYTWKVVAIYGETEETSPEWTFETRDISFYLSPPINPTPDIDATGVPVRTAALTWENGGGATSYDVYFREGTTGDFTKLTTTSTAALTKAVSGLKYTTAYTWRVDAHNQWGTVAGTEWAFTVFALIPPLPTGQNAMATVRRLAAVANNAFWYESI